MIIDSLNLTNRAFGKNKYFNYEADILLWGNEYCFKYEKLSKKKSPPIICNVIDKEQEVNYIEMYWKLYKEIFTEVVDRI